MEIETKGTIFLEKTGKSKSEHLAVFLRTTKGNFKLRRLGKNPFFDEFLHKLDGKTVNVKGILDGKLILAKEIE